ncbi:MAG: hypothetical protein K8T26_07490 [Lentisphaerae bacterium]|nr:hypothetical protein [Lentisphaerota bacterium]
MTTPGRALHNLLTCARMGMVMIGMLLAPACASPASGPSVIDVAVAPDGTVSVEGEPVTMQRLPKALKANGATRTTGIYVSVPDETSPEILRTLTETMATAGYPRVMFRKPVKAIAVVE